MYILAREILRRRLLTLRARMGRRLLGAKIICLVYEVSRSEREKGRESNLSACDVLIHFTEFHELLEFRVTVRVALRGLTFTFLAWPYPFTNKDVVDNLRNIQAIAAGTARTRKFIYSHAIALLVTAW